MQSRPLLVLCMNDTVMFQWSSSSLLVFAMVFSRKTGGVGELAVVDESVAKLDKTLPPLVKQVSFQAFSVAVKAPEVARGVASEVQRAGLKDTASGIAKNIYTKYEPTAKVLYSKYEPVAEHYAVSAWQSLNRLPLFPQVAQLVVATVALCSEKYNQTVMVGAERGYRVANYLPLVPTEKIAKVYGASEDELPPVVNGNNATVSAH